MTHLYLIRHGDNVDGMEGGKSVDLGLSPEGVQQVERLRDRLAKSGEIQPDTFIASPERRALETAHILAPVFARPMVLDDDVIEWRSDDGSLSAEEFMARWAAVPTAQKAYYRWIDGYESLMEFGLRVRLTLNRLLQAHEGETIVIITHGAFIQLSFNHFFGFSEASREIATPEIRRASITHWVRSSPAERWTLERSNDCHHLTEALP